MKTSNQQKYKKQNMSIFLLYIYIIFILGNFVLTKSLDCDFHSASETDSYWYFPSFKFSHVSYFFSMFREAIGKCSACSTDPNCGYCLSTLQCLPGLEDGPLDNLPCPEWIFESFSCPGKLHLLFL
jgi:hypothetical protein